jgi:hypothetical protein
LFLPGAVQQIAPEGTVNASKRKVFCLVQNVAGEGYGIVSLMDGRMSGGDNLSSFTGTYVQDGDNFAATIAVRRHTEGPPSVFGIDNVDITLSGKSTPTTASCIGTANQARAALQATLIRIAD